MAQIGDLTTLEAVIDWVNTSGQAYPPGDDGKLAHLITSASRFVRSYLVSPIVPATYVEKRNGTGTNALFLRNRPVVSVAALLIANVPQDPAVNTDGSGWKNDDTTIYVPGTFFPCGTLNVQVTYTAGYQATAPIEIPGTDGNSLSVHDLQGTSLVDGTPAWTWNSDQGVALSDGTALALVKTAPAAGQYQLVEKAGKWSYAFNAAQAGAQATVTYGYTPADLQEAVTELVAERFKTRNRIGQNSVNMGNGQTVSFSTKDMNDYIKGVLQNYKNVVPV